MDIPEGYIKKKGKTIPFGYRLSNSTEGYLAPIPEQLELLNKYIVSVQEQEMSLREAAEALSCLLYTSPSPRDLSTSRMPSSA